MGYARKGSLPSLLGGISVGFLFIVSGFALTQNRPTRTGYRGALAASALLLCSSLPRVSKGPVPAVLSVLGTLLTAYYGNAYFKKAST